MYDVYMYVCIYCIRMYVRTCMYVCTYMYVCMYVHMYVYVFLSSRQRYVLGDNAMKKMAQSDIFISGMGGLGIEIGIK